MRTTVAAVMAVMAIGAVGCGGKSSDRARATASARSGGSEIAIHLIAYNPPSLDVSPGTKVQWMQQDAGFHTVTSGTASTDASGTITTHPEGQFASGKLATGKDFSFTFATPGIYRYFCEIHPGTMHGVVTVK